MDMTWVTDRIAVGGGIWVEERMAEVAALLQGFRHTVCLEVYSPGALDASLKRLMNAWNRWKVEG